MRQQIDAQNDHKFCIIIKDYVLVSIHTDQKCNDRFSSDVTLFEMAFKANLGKNVIHILQLPDLWQRSSVHY